ncbi:substrate-binding domain-containing protein [Mycolicibacterium mengxianglii]|uniref:substrate-binding domain-containing protein n=1 Tax=Mycolicibacterium mengxianglii TaxID=2736649 RepID=UPI0018D074D7|nr:substrate-binding domain-containing protein [Mycolicibacterium mengxianglii]
MTLLKTRRAALAALAGAAVVTMGTVTACGAGDSGASDGRKTIGVTVYDMSSFITAGKSGMETYAAANDIDLVWKSAGGDVSTQADQVDQYINQGVDAIIVVPVQADSLQPQIEAANNADVPVLAVNAALSDDSKLAATVLPDDVAAGKQQMQQMVDKLGGRGNIVILQTKLGSSYEIDRTAGNQEVLAANPGIKVLAMDTGDNTRDIAVNKMRNWITAFGPQIDGIVAQNDDMGLGALQAVKEAGLSIPIVGIDGIEDGLNAVKSGDFIATSLQHGTIELAGGLAVAKRVADGEDMSREFVYTMPPVDAGNIDEVLSNVVTDRQALLDRLPAVIDKNVETGDMANEN